MATIKIDPDGDLRLLVGEKKVPFIVCAKTLARSAPVWKTMLYGPFLESKRPEEGQGEWTIELPEDDQAALEVVLHLIHGQPHKLPNMTVDLAFEVTVLTNKYNMTSCLWLVAKEWLEELPKGWACSCKPSTGSPPCYTGEGPPTSRCQMPPLEWLWITQELGDLYRYRTTLQDFALQIGTCGKTEALEAYNRSWSVPEEFVKTGSNLALSGNIIRASLVDEIRTARHDAWKVIQAPYLKAVERIKTLTLSNNSWSPTSDFNCIALEVDQYSRIRCDLAMLGALSVWKTTCDPWTPLMPLKRQHHSPAQAHFVLSSAVRCWEGRLIRLLLSGEHEECSPFRKVEVPDLTTIWKGAGELPVKKIEYINAQAILSGLQRREASRPSVKHPHDQWQGWE